VVVAAGFLLAMRIGADGTYWTTTLPAMLVIALGMSGAVAPLTTAVLTSVAPRHTGVAAGFNSAVARSGGLIATALLGMVLSAHGAALLAAFQIAAVVAGMAALAAGACAFIWLEGAQAKTPDSTQKRGAR
jgi:MFS family permease